VHVEGGDVGEGMNRPAKRGPHELEQHPPYATVDDGVLFPHCADTMSFAPRAQSSFAPRARSSFAPRARSSFAASAGVRGRTMGSCATRRRRGDP
jgi:hypothetical protein